MQINGWYVVPFVQKNTKKSKIVLKVLIMNETIFMCRKQKHSQQTAVNGFDLGVHTFASS